MREYLSGKSFLCHMSALDDKLIRPKASSRIQTKAMISFRFKEVLFEFSGKHKIYICVNVYLENRSFAT